MVFSAPTYAVHDTGRFQLDGDASSSTLGTPPAVDDWDKVCHQYGPPGTACGSASDTTGSTAGLWTCDTSRNTAASCTLNATVFTGGGSKDPQLLSSWNWKDGAGGLPAKDNLVHAFAVRYSLTPSATCPSLSSTCEVIYFGLDRYDNSGDAQNGFWFFKGKVGLNADGSFSGSHQNGDVLVVSDFSIGGTNSIITVYTWDDSCTATNKPAGYCADANLHTQASSTAANCASPTPNTGDPFCGIVNANDGTTVPWSSDYTDKSGNNSYLKGEFYEAGINLSSFGLGGECFSSIGAESRSSTSTTATLKDFVLGTFSQCAPSLTTQASTNGTVTPGTAVHDTATITVTGAATPDDATGTVDFYLCGPSATANPDCSTDGTSAGSGKTLVDTSNPANPKDGKSGANSDDVNTSASKLAPGYYCFAAVAHLTNYDSPGRFTDSSNECFRVKDTSTTTTAQNWLPNDTATVKLSDGTTNGTGTVTFSLYENGSCDAIGLKTTFGPITLVNGMASTNNTSTYVTPGKTISWRVTFTPSDPNAVGGSTSHCEMSVLTINDDTGS